MNRNSAIGVLYVAIISGTLSLGADELPNRLPPTNPEHLDCSSPQAAFELYRRSTEKKDWEMLFSVLSPGVRDTQIFEIMFAEGIKGDPQLSKIAAKYFDEEMFEKLAKSLGRQATDEEAVRLVASCVSDKRGLYVNAMTWLNQISDQREAWSHLRAVVRQGSKAKGTATHSGMATNRRETIEIEMPIYFVKQHGKWLYATRSEWSRAD